MRHKLRQTVGQQLDYWADGLSTTLNHGDQLDVAALRRTAPEASAFVVLASDGTVIETHGFVKGSIIYAALPAGLAYDHLVQVKSSLGEEWNVLAHKSDGRLISPYLVMMANRLSLRPTNANFAQATGKLLPTS